VIGIIWATVWLIWFRDNPSAIMFPLLLNEETGSANTFFMLAAGLNFVAIAIYEKPRYTFGEPFETNGHEYLKTLAVQESVYESASKNATVSVNQ